MDPVASMLSQLGVSIASQAIYDFAKSRIRGAQQSASSLAEGLAQEFPSLTVDGADVVAHTVIDFFAERGFIQIRGSSIYARKSVWMRSAAGTKLTFGDGSTSSTDRTRIDAGKGAQIIATGGAEIRQNEDGSISFRT